MSDTKISARGRPRAFDKDQAVDTATRLFWKQGFDGTSLAELTAAMGINPPSLYACFGSKEGLFRAALDRYGVAAGTLWEAALAAPTLREVIQGLLAIASEGGGDTRGCLLVQAGLTTGAAAAPMREEMAVRRRAGEAAVRVRIAQGAANGELLPGTDPEALTLTVVALVRGMAVLAADGTSAEALNAMARQALTSLPLRSDFPPGTEPTPGVNSPG